MERMGVQPILPVKESITIDTMLNFNGDFNLFVGSGSSQISIHLNHQNDQFDTFSKLELSNLTKGTTTSSITKLGVLKHWRVWRGAPAPSPPNVFNFMQFFWKFGEIICWWPPPLPRIRTSSYGERYSLHATFLPHGFRREVGVTPGTVPVPGHGFGVVCDDDTEVLGDSLEEEPGAPQLVTHVDPLTRTDLELPLQKQSQRNSNLRTFGSRVTVIITAHQRSFGKIMFSVISVCLSICQQRVPCNHYPWYFGPHCTAPHPTPNAQGIGPRCTGPWYWHLVAKNWRSVQTCSLEDLMVQGPLPMMLTSGGWLLKYVQWYPSYWNAFLC